MDGDSAWEDGEGAKEGAEASSVEDRAVSPVVVVLKEKDGVAFVAEDPGVAGNEIADETDDEGTGNGRPAYVLGSFGGGRGAGTRETNVG